MLNPSLPVRSRIVLAAVVAFTCLAIVNTCRAGDWTEFRGPGGQGHADVTGLPTSWSETENIAWKVEIAGNGWSSPVVGGNRIYLTAAVSIADSDKQQSLRVICLDGRDGSEIWSREAFQQTDEEKVQIHKKNSHASSSPILDGDRLYVHFGPHGTACLDLKGNILWRQTELNYKPVHGNGGSPALADDMLVICCDGSNARFVVGLNKSDGKEVWRTEREFEPSRGFSFCTPAIIEAGGRQQAICPGSGGVFSYDPKTGEQLWRVQYGEGYSVVPRPVVGHGLVYVCSGFGDGQLFAIDPTGSGDVTETHVQWKVKKGVPKSPSILLVGTEIYMSDDGGIGTCVDALTGELIWQNRLGRGCSASPTFADGHIYFQMENGETVVLNPGLEYDEVSKNMLGEDSRTFASFSFVDKAILLRSETHLYRIEQK